MGLEYLLANKSNKQMYYLGKGSWLVLADDKEALYDLEYLSSVIFDDVFCSDDADFKEYIDTKVSVEIYNFCKVANASDIIIFNDAGDDLTICKSLGYVFVGCRYEDYSLNELNSHLKDDRNHMYNPDDYKNYKKYSLYV